MIGDLEGPGAWDEHRLRAAVPAHRDQPPIYGGDHAAPGDAADLLRLHQHPIANLDHRRLLWMVTKPGHSKCPQDRRLHSIRAAVAIALALPVVLQVSRIADGILLLWALVDPSSTERIRSRRPGRPRSTRSQSPSRCTRYSAKAQGMPLACTGSADGSSWKVRD